MRMRFMVPAAAAVAMTAGLPLSGQAPAPQGQMRLISRTPDGKPNLNGIWQVVNSANWDLEAHSAEDGIPGGLGVVEGGTIPYLPAALAVRNEHRINRKTAAPVGKCFIPGVPCVTYLPFPFQLLQAPKYAATSY